MLIGLQRLLEPLAETRLEFFLGDIPDPRLCVCGLEIDAVGPSILRIDVGNRIRHGGPAIDTVRQFLVGMHAGRQLVDDLAIGLHHQRHQSFLAFQRQGGFSLAIEAVPRHGISRVQFIGPGHDPGEIITQALDLRHLPFIGHMPIIGIFRSATCQQPELLNLAVIGCLDGAKTGKRRLACSNPAVDQARMVDQKRRHAKAGGIADTQFAANLRIKSDGGSRCRHPRHMFGQINRKSPDQPHSQHFRLEGTGEFGAGGPVHAVSSAKFAGAIDSCGAYQIANLVNHGRIGLHAGSQRVDHMFEQPDGFVRAREHHLRIGDPAGFLLRHICRQTLDLSGIDLAVTQREGGVPCLGNHPV